MFLLTSISIILLTFY